MKNISLFAITICLLAGCSTRDLKNVESYINDRPDSALAVLKNFDTRRLVTTRQKAHYSLLLSKALDKNYIDLTTDSLIMPAFRYYSRRRDYHKKAEAYFYLGRVQFNARQVNDAIINFHKALDAAEKTDDEAIKGLICLSIGLSYNNCYASTDELEYMKRTFQHFKKTGQKYLIDNGHYYLAHAYHNGLQLHTAEPIYDSLINAPGVDSSIVRDCLMELSNLCVEYPGPTEKPEKSIALFNRAIEYGVQPELDDWAKYALALNLVGRKEESEDIMSELDVFIKSRDSLVTDADKVAFLNMRWIIDRNNGDYESAMFYADSSYRLQDKVVEEELRQAASRTIRQYYQADAVSQRSRAEKNLLIIVILILAFALCALLWSLFYLKRKRAAEEERVRLEGIIEEGRRIERDLTLAVDDTSKENDSLVQRNVKLQRMLKKSLHSEFREMSDLADEILSRKHEKSRAYVKGLVYNKVNTIAQSLTDDDSYKEIFEKKVNGYLDNVMVKIRRDLPGLKPEYYKVVCFSICGLDANYIGFLLGGMSANMVYWIKNKVKTQLLEMDTENLDLYETLL